MLPYLEQNNVFRAFDQAAGAYAEMNDALRRTRIVVLRCPSSPDPVGFGRSGIQVSNYVGCHNSVEAPIDTTNDGILFLNSAIRFDDILDGSSNTLLLGERIFDDAKPGEDAAPEYGWPSGTRGTLRNAGRVEQVSPGRTGVAAAEEEPAGGPLWVGGFGAYHPGMAVIGMADGATRALSFTIDKEVLHALGSRAGGELPSSEW